MPVPGQAALTNLWCVSIRVLAGYAILLGFGIIIGGPARMPAVTHGFLTGTAAPWAWGLTLMAAGAAAASSNFHVIRVGCVAAALWFAVFTTAFFVAWVQSDTAPVTSWVTYAFVSLLWVFTARAVRSQ